LEPHNIFIVLKTFGRQPKLNAGAEGVSVFTSAALSYSLLQLLNIHNFHPITTGKVAEWLRRCNALTTPPPCLLVEILKIVIPYHSL
jgi:hypothetical protein